MTNKLEALSSLARWKAFVRKYRGFTSTVKDEQGFVAGVHDYQKTWIANGIGTPLARIEDVDVIEALIDFDISIDEISKYGVDDLKLYFKACLALEYDGEDV